MVKNFFLCLFFVVLLSGCSWLAILDTNSYNDKDPAGDAWAYERMSEIRDALLGKAREDVIEMLGKSKYIQKFEPAYRFMPRNSYIVFNQDKICDLRECGDVVFDETWGYSLERRNGSAFTSIGYAVHFFKDRVVAVD